MASTIADPNLRPALEAPPGVTSNLIDPPNQQHAIIITMVVYLALTTPFVLARMYTRHIINRRLWWDDYTCIAAWIGLFATASVTLKAMNYGAGVDLWNVSEARGAKFTKLFSKIEILARVSITCTKVSILLLFQRIFVPPQTRKSKLYYAIWFVIWFVVLYCLALILVVLLQCVNKVEVPGHTCINTFTLLVTASTINVLSDIMMLIIPAVAVWNLHMPAKRKLGLYVVFAVGIAATASSVARLGWQVHRARDPNRTIVLMKVILLALAEHAIGIIVGCMPVLPGLYRYYVKPKSQSRSSKSRTESWKRAIGSGTFGSGGKRKKRSHDPYLLTTDYKELDDIEHGHMLPEEIKGTTTTIKGGCSETSISNQAVEGLHQNPNTKAVVTRSVQVDSYPRAMDANPIAPPPVHMKR